MHRRALPRSRRVALGIAGLAAAAVLAGCSDSDAASPTTTASSAESDGGGSAGDGAALYAESCALCHGADLRGSAMGPSHLSQVYEPGHHSDDSFRNAVANGSPAHHWDFGDMPPVPGLSDDEVDAIIAFVRQQQETHGFEPYPPN